LKSGKFYQRKLFKLDKIRIFAMGIKRSFQ